MAFLDEIGLAELWSIIREADESVLAEATKVESGSYTGTGTYGSSNKNSLTFGFVPKIVFIFPNKPSATVSNSAIHQYWGAYIPGVGVGFFGDCESGLSNTLTSLVFSFSGSTLTWYTTYTNNQYNAQAQQLNLSGEKYNYIAIG